MYNIKLFFIAVSSLVLHNNFYGSLISALQLSENVEILIYSGVNQTGKRELISIGQCHNLDDRKNSLRPKVPLIKSVDLRRLSCVQVWQYECCTGDFTQIPGDDTPALSNLYSHRFRAQKDSPEFQARSISPCSTSLSESAAPSTIQDLFVHPEDRIESKCGSSGLVNVKYFETENTAVYFSFPVDEKRVNWIYEFMDVGWAYVKKVYGPSYGKLHGIFNLPSAGSQSQSDLKETFGPATALHSRSSCRNLLRIDLNDQNQTAQDSDGLGRMMSEIVEGSFGGILGSPSYWITGNGHGNFSYFSDIFTYDIYTKFKMDKDAQRIEEEAIKRGIKSENSASASGSASVLLPGKNWFSDWYKPIYEKNGGSTFLRRFLQLRRDNFKIDAGDSSLLVKIPVFSETMNLGEFILFCGGAAKMDLKDKATSVFGEGGTWQKELEAAAEKYPKVKNEYQENQNT